MANPTRAKPRPRLTLALGVLVSVSSGFSGMAQAEDPATTGSVTKLPIPRFVSLKPSDTPMREGPSKEHRIKWVFKREGLPVEVIGEHEQWRRVRDSESTDGWVYFGRLSNRRTVIVRAPKEIQGKEAQNKGGQNKGGNEQNLFREEREASTIIARLQPGVVASVETCSVSWCKVSVEGYAGYLRKDALWGVYADERVK